MSDLPQVDEAAPRRRNTAKKPAAPKKAVVPKAVAPKGDPAEDLQVRDQLARAAQAREAALAEAAKSAVPEVPPVPEVAAPVPPVAPVAQQVVTPAGGSPMLVDQSLVNVLKTVKTTSLADFEGFLQELQPLVTLWHAAPHEAAARRHALSILLLIKERF